MSTYKKKKKKKKTWTTVKETLVRPKQVLYWPDFVTRRRVFRVSGQQSLSAKNELISEVRFTMMCR
jgi:hypothetical protein